MIVVSLGWIGKVIWMKIDFNICPDCKKKGETRHYGIETFFQCDKCTHKMLKKYVKGYNEEKI